MRLRHPSDFFLVWIVLIIATGLLAALGLGTAAVILGGLSSIPLLIGCVGQGVRIGMDAHRGDRLIEKHLHTADD